MLAANTWHHSAGPGQCASTLSRNMRRHGHKQRSPSHPLLHPNPVCGPGAPLPPSRSPPPHHPLVGAQPAGHGARLRRHARQPKVRQLHAAVRVQQQVAWGRRGGSCWQWLLVALGFSDAVQAGSTAWAISPSAGRQAGRQAAAARQRPSHCRSLAPWEPLARTRAQFPFTSLGPPPSPPSHTSLAARPPARQPPTHRS